jgi:hypothetical protein
MDGEVEVGLTDELGRKRGVGIDLDAEVCDCGLQVAPRRIGFGDRGVAPQRFHRPRRLISACSATARPMAAWTCAHRAWVSRSSSSSDNSVGSAADTSGLTSVSSDTNLCSLLMPQTGRGQAFSSGAIQANR